MIDNVCKCCHVNPRSRISAVTYVLYNYPLVLWPLAHKSSHFRSRGRAQERDTVDGQMGGRKRQQSWSSWREVYTEQVTVYTAALL